MPIDKEKAAIATIVTLWAFNVVVSVGAFVGFVWVAVHFIRKFW